MIIEREITLGIFLEPGCFLTSETEFSNVVYRRFFTRECRVFSRDVTAAMLVSLNKGTAAMLVSPTNPLGIELYFYAVFPLFCFKNMLIDHVSENTLYPRVLVRTFMQITTTA